MALFLCAGRTPRETIWYGGDANQLSPETIAYPRIEGIHEATKLGSVASAPPGPTVAARSSFPGQRPPGSPSETWFAARRSALDFVGGTQSISLPQLSAILTAATAPLAADFGGAHFVQLYLYAHRVDGLEPGVYRLWRERAELERIKSGDQRFAAAGLSLGQDLAGNACIAFSMIGDLDRAVRGLAIEVIAMCISKRARLASACTWQRKRSGCVPLASALSSMTSVHRYLGIPPERGTGGVPLCDRLSGSRSAGGGITSMIAMLGT